MENLFVFSIDSPRDSHCIVKQKWKRKKNIAFGVEIYFDSKRPIDDRICSETAGYEGDRNGRYKIESMESGRMGLGGYTGGHPNGSTLGASVPGRYFEAAAIHHSPLSSILSRDSGAWNSAVAPKIPSSAESAEQQSPGRRTRSGRSPGLECIKLSPVRATQPVPPLQGWVHSIPCLPRAFALGSVV
jgi:hypothetical protein